jgi:phosphoglycerate kinase
VGNLCNTNAKVKCKFWWAKLFTKKTVKEVDLSGKRVLMRADYNVPVENGIIGDDYRLLQNVPTIQYILEQRDSKLIILSHLGRPKSAEDKQFSLAPVAKRLSELLSREVRFAPDCIGDEVKKMSDELPAGGVLLLENVRFHPEEEKNDPNFAKAIVDSTGGEIFVQDGFGVVHRAHATTDAVAKILMGVAGLLLEKEVDTITNAMENPARPLTVVVGGAKISDKIDFVNNLLDKADCMAVGGAMANTFLLAEGFKVGASMAEQDVIDTAKEIIERAREAEKTRGFNFLVPVDAVVSKSIKGDMPTRVVDLASHSLSDIQAYPKKPEPPAYEIADDEMILDIGPMSASKIAGAVQMSKTVIWNGTCGVAEVKGIAGASDPFAHGTRIVVDAMIGASNNHQNKPYTLVGGGDTDSYVDHEGLREDFNHVSTGGGASLELMAGKTLPGVNVLWDK